MTRNTELLIKVANHIAAHPELHDQGYWFHENEDDGDNPQAVGFVQNGKTPAQLLRDDIKQYNRSYRGCDTQCCVAGWAAALADDATFARAERDCADGSYWGDESWLKLGQHLLGLNEREASLLFWETANSLPTSRENLVQLLRHLAETGEFAEGLLGDKG